MSLADFLSDLFSGPSVNIDGTAMVGSVDTNGNPYGVTNSWKDDVFSSDSCGTDSFGSCGSFGSSWD